MSFIDSLVAKLKELVASLTASKEKPAEQMYGLAPVGAAHRGLPNDPRLRRQGYFDPQAQQRRRLAARQQYYSQKPRWGQMYAHPVNVARPTTTGLQPRRSPGYFGVNARSQRMDGASAAPPSGADVIAMLRERQALGIEKYPAYATTRVPASGYNQTIGIGPARDDVHTADEYKRNIHNLLSQPKDINIRAAEAAMANMEDARGIARAAGVPGAF